LYLYFQGEPFIHKDFIEMIRMAHDRHIYTITSTNGHYLTPRKAEEVVRSGLDRILISIDGSTQDVYEQYRIGGNLEKVIEGTKNLVEAKQRLKSPHPEIVFQMLVVRPNELQISEVEKLATSLGVDQLVLKTAQVYDFENGNSLIPTIEKYARYKQMPNGKWKIKSELKNQCWKMWHSAVSTWDGQMIPCCFDKDAKYAMGNLQKETISEIWNNEKYKDFRSKILKSRSEIDICKNCSEGTKVWETVS
jgi:radical SAM protein with 4Fe4S-binding SPASM domain